MNATRRALTMRQHTLTAPSSWASYLINGDASGMEDDEIEACDEWIESESLGTPVDCSEESNFITYHDARAHYPYAADCSTYTFLTGNGVSV